MRDQIIAENDRVRLQSGREGIVEQIRPIGDGEYGCARIRLDDGSTADSPTGYLTRIPLLLALACLLGLGACADRYREPIHPMGYKPPAELLDLSHAIPASVPNQVRQENGRIVIDGETVPQ